MAGPTEHHAVTVADAWDETGTLRALRLQLPAAVASLHQRPGQVVKVKVAPGEAYFALATAPAAGGLVELLVKRGGPVGDAVAAAATPGARLEVTAPFGRGFQVEEALGRDVLLFAAGSGIAPIRSLVQVLLARREEVDRVVLFYGQRRGAEFAYRGEHLGWERHGVRVVLCPSGEDDTWPGVHGRVQEAATALDWGGARPAQATAFVCGMSPMVKDVRAALAAAGAPPERVHVNF
jgi:sulfhydrogenase subunit gamma (sulfur reductase)